MAQIPNQIVALDVGDKRIGVAVASVEARLPRPLVTLANDDDFSRKLADIIDKEAIGAIVVGLPRGMEGQHTAQTVATEKCVERLNQTINLPMIFQDEALTSQKAEEELGSRHQAFTKDEVDALAASYILQDFLIDFHDMADVTDMAV